MSAVVKPCVQLLMVITALVVITEYSTMWTILAWWGCMLTACTRWLWACSLCVWQIWNFNRI